MTFKGQFNFIFHLPSVRGGRVSSLEIISLCNCYCLIFLIILYHLKFLFKGLLRYTIFGTMVFFSLEGSGLLYNNDSSVRKIKTMKVVIITTEQRNTDVPGGTMNTSILLWTIVIHGPAALTMVNTINSTVITKKCTTKQYLTSICLQTTVMRSHIEWDETTSTVGHLCFQIINCCWTPFKWNMLNCEHVKV